MSYRESNGGYPPQQEPYRESSGRYTQQQDSRREPQYPDQQETRREYSQVQEAPRGPRYSPHEETRRELRYPQQEEMRSRYRYSPPEEHRRESQYPSPGEAERTRIYNQPQHQRVASNEVTLPSINPYTPSYSSPSPYPPYQERYHQDSYRSTPPQDPYRGAGPSHDSYRGAGLSQDPYRGAGPSQDSYRGAGPSHDPYRGAGPSQDPYREAGPSQDPYREAGPSQDTYNRAAGPSQDLIPYRGEPSQDLIPYREAGPSQDAYRDNRGGYQLDYRPPPPPPQPAFTPSAPRQRTAIACRYCRRRKIRCSGFEQNPKGQCQNCARFSQECIFTPVSASAQAFVPAHALYPQMRNMGVAPDGSISAMEALPPVQLFGAHGQPLGIQPRQITNGASSAYPEHQGNSPPGSYAPIPEPQYKGLGKRPAEEPLNAILAQPAPAPPQYTGADSRGLTRTDSGSRRSAIDDDMRLPPVAIATSNHSPQSTSSSRSLPIRQGPSLPSLSRTPPPPRASSGERSDRRMALGNIIDQPQNDIDRDDLTPCSIS